LRLLFFVLRTRDSREAEPAIPRGYFQSADPREFQQRPSDRVQARDRKPTRADWSEERVGSPTPHDVAAGAFRAEVLRLERLTVVLAGSAAIAGQCPTFPRIQCKHRLIFGNPTAGGGLARGNSAAAALVCPGKTWNADSRAAVRDGIFANCAGIVCEDVTYIRVGCDGNRSIPVNPVGGKLESFQWRFCCPPLRNDLAAPLDCPWIPCERRNDSDAGRRRCRWMSGAFLPPMVVSG